MSQEVCEMRCLSSPFTTDLTHHRNCTIFVFSFSKLAVLKDNSSCSGGFNIGLSV